jgi:hypothetical protein
MLWPMQAAWTCRNPQVPYSIPLLEHAIRIPIEVGLFHCSESENGTMHHHLQIGDGGCGVHRVVLQELWVYSCRLG